jgi:hypothetical protein
LRRFRLDGALILKDIALIVQARLSLASPVAQPATACQIELQLIQIKG